MSSEAPRELPRHARGELSLQERDEMFRQLASSIDQVLWMADLSSSGMLYVSPAYEAIWGRSVDSLLDSTHSWVESIHPEDRGRLLRAAARRSEGGYSEEYRIIRPDGGIRWIHERAFPIRNEAGAVYRIAGIARDITEHVRAEEQLHLLSQAIDQLPVAVLIANRGRQIEYVNRQVVQATGYAREELIGSSSALFRGSGTAPARYDQMIAEVAAGGLWQGDHTARRKDGTEIPINTVWAPLRNAAGEVTHFVLIARDISERLRAEAQLRKLSYAIEQSPLAVVIVNRERTIEYANAAASQLTGCAREELIGRSSRMFRTPVTPDSSYDAIIGEVVAGRQWQGAHCFRRKDGSDLPIHSIWAPLCDDGGQVTHMVLIGRDISAEQQTAAAQERLQRQLLQAQKMEAIGQLTGGIAHDFNNILVAVLGYANLALQRCVHDPAGKLPEYLREVIAAGERGRDLVAKLLTYSRAEPDRIAQPLDVLPVVRETLALLSASIPASVRLETELPLELPPVLLARIDLQQILMNLVINARDATDEKGRVRIQLRRARLSGEDCAQCHQPVDGRFVELVVADDGRGIAAADVPRIFDPFFTTKEPGKGTGLGLSVVAGIVHKAGGHILVESRAGSGTIVRICLPLAGERVHMAVTPVEPPASEATAVGSGRVLLVDDEPSVVKFLGELLESHGYRVTSFSDPVAALRRFEADPLAFDLVLADQTMPVLTGVELTRAILARRPGMPVILASGYSSSVNAATAREAGASAFVPKPVSAGKLLQLMGRVLSGAPAP